MGGAAHNGAPASNQLKFMTQHHASSKRSACSIRQHAIMKSRRGFGTRTPAPADGTGPTPLKAFCKEKHPPVRGGRHFGPLDILPGRC